MDWHVCILYLGMFPWVVIVRTMAQIRRFVEYKSKIKDPELILALMSVMW
jgi:hypothetical protein